MELSNDYPRMLYKAGGNEEIHDGRFSTLIVGDADAHEAATAEGWSLTTGDALKAKADAEAADKQPAEDAKPPTREELEQMADKLGIEYSARVSDKKLRALVEAAATTEA